MIESDILERYKWNLEAASQSHLESESQSMRTWGWTDSQALAALFGPGVMVTEETHRERARLAYNVAMASERERMVNAELVQREVDRQQRRLQAGH